MTTREPRQISRLRTSYEPPPPAEPSYELQPAELARSRLNEIAAIIGRLTYGEMIELARGIWQARPSIADRPLAGEQPLNEATLPATLHAWAQGK